MRFASLASALAAASLAAAQTVIEVGSVQSAQGGIFQFIPDNITARNGTVITFKWTGAPGNHSVTQSSFASPCNPLQGGFDSGFVFIPPSNVSNSPEWNLTITNDARPIWFYCKQLAPSPHCAAGMVGAINAPTTGNNTFAAFQANARQFQGNSGQGTGGLTGVGANASALPSPITGGASLAGAPATSAAATSSSGAPAPTSSHKPNAAISLAGMGTMGVASLALFIGTLLV